MYKCARIIYVALYIKTNLNAEKYCLLDSKEFALSSIYASFVILKISKVNKVDIKSHYEI